MEASDPNPFRDAKRFRLKAGLRTAFFISPAVKRKDMEIKTSKIPLRALGRTGVDVTAIGVGGYHLGLVKDDKETRRLVYQGIKAGITLLGNARGYHDGRSEELMGRSVHDRRDKVFLMTKVCTHGRDRHVAMRQLEESLRRLKTDYLDLWQVHEVVYDNEPELHFAKGGVIEALEQARREGKVRFIGFTGHKSPEMHLKMLSYDYPFDTCQLPLNCFDANFRSFDQRVLPNLEGGGIGALGRKSLGGEGNLVNAGVVTAEEALRYAMSLPIATVVSGMESLDVLRQNLGVARSFTPMSADEMRQ